MKSSKITTFLQSLFSVSRNELMFAGLLLLGLTIGMIYKYMIDDSPEKTSKKAEMLYRALDSLAEAEKKTYTGIDFRENYDTNAAQPELSSVRLKFGNKNTTAGNKLNLNTATFNELLTLDFVGVKTATAIIDYRKKYGFKTIEDLQNVVGIGKIKYEKIKELVEVK